MATLLDRIDIVYALVLALLQNDQTFAISAFGTFDLISLGVTSESD
jgi:hypothetical protein